MLLENDVNFVAASLETLSVRGDVALAMSRLPDLAAQLHALATKVGDLEDQ